MQHLRQAKGLKVSVCDYKNERTPKEIEYTKRRMTRNRTRGGRSGGCAPRVCLGGALGSLGVGAGIKRTQSLQTLLEPCLASDADPPNENANAEQWGLVELPRQEPLQEPRQEPRQYPSYEQGQVPTQVQPQDPEPEHHIENTFLDHGAIQAAPSPGHEHKVGRAPRFKHLAELEHIVASAMSMEPGGLGVRNAESTYQHKLRAEQLFHEHVVRAGIDDAARHALAEEALQKKLAAAAAADRAGGGARTFRRSQQRAAGELLVAKRKTALDLEAARALSARMDAIIQLQNFGMERISWEGPELR